MDGLPRQFLSSLRILFDILDENRTGFVRLRDIETRWSDDGVRGLPPGVVDGLRKVTPPNGFLNFDRFVAGLKLVLASKKQALYTETTDNRKPFASKENRLPLFSQEGDRNSQPTLGDANISRFVIDGKYNNKPFNGSNYLQQRPQYKGQNDTQDVSTRPQEHRQDLDSRKGLEGHWKPSHFQTKNHAGFVQRDARSYNAYAIKPDVSNYPTTVGSHHGPSSGAGNFGHPISNNNPIPHHQDKPPAIPPRTDKQSTKVNAHIQPIKKSQSGPNLHSFSPPAVPPREHQSNARVLNDLKNWQKDWTSSQNVGSKNDPEHMSRPKKYSDIIYANIEQFQHKTEDQQQPPGQSKATVRRHGSGRRHTLANGIDQNMLKRMKQLEEETSILRSGLVMVETAGEWYKKQLTAVSDKQAMLGKVSYNDNSVEAYQERMNFQRARIAEVNQHLQTLLQSSEKGFPLHMNLAMSSGVSNANNTGDAASRHLKEQNRRLLEELGQKREQVSVLEKEKTSLVRELFEARSKNQHSNHDDTTFM